MIEEEKILKNEKAAKIETGAENQKEKEGNPEKIVEKVKILSAKVIERGGELREKVKKRSPAEEIINEFDKEEKLIEDEAKSAANLIIKTNNMENRGDFHPGLTLNEIFESIKKRAEELYDSGMTLDEKKQEIKKLIQEQTEAINDKSFNDDVRKARKWFESGNTLYDIEKKLNNAGLEKKDNENMERVDVQKSEKDSLGESESSFEDALKSIEHYNQTMPNYFKKRSENLGNIIDELKNKKADREIISLVEKIVIEDRRKMIESMCRKENIDIYYANPGSDSSNIELSSSNLYIENLLKKSIKESDMQKQLEKVDKELTAIVNDFAIDLFSEEYIKAKSFFETAGKSNSEKEKQVYYMVAQHILDSIEKGIRNAGIKRALKNKF